MIKKLLLLILLVVTSGLTMIAKNTLDLTQSNNPTLKINGKNIIAKEGTNLIIKTKDSITINKIVFAKNGNESKFLVINIGDSTIKQKDGIKNDISTEIKLVSKNTLTISWGDKNWTFKMEKEKLHNTPQNNTANKTMETQASSNNFMYLIVGAVMLVIGFIIGGNIHRLCRIFKRKKKNSLEQKDDNKNEKPENKKQTNELNDENTDVTDSESEKKSVNQVEEDVNYKDNSNKEINTTNISTDIKNELDEQIVTINKEYKEYFFKDCIDDNSKVERLQEIFSNYIYLSNGLKNVSKVLCDNEKFDFEKMLIEIRSLKSKLTKYENNKGSNNDNREISVSKLEDLIKANGISKTFYGDTTGDFENRFKQLLNKLCKRIENSIDTTSNGIYEANKYVIKRLKQNGLEKYFVSNTNLEDGIERIKEDIEKSRQSSTLISDFGDNNDTGINLSYDIESIVKELHSQLPDISDSISSLDDLVIAIQELIKNQSDVAKTGDSSSSEIIGEMAINDFLKKIGIQPTETQEDAIKQIEEAIAKRKELDDICKKYKADSGKELLTAIKEQIYKNIKGQLESKSEIKDIIANCRTAEGIVKELSDAYTDVSLNKQILEKERNNFASNLKEAHTNEGNVEPIDDSDLNAMFNAYRNAVCQKVNTANEKIVTLEKEKEEQKDIIETNNETFNKMRSEMLDVLNEDINDIQKSIAGTFIRPCDISLKSQSDDNQSLLRDSFKKFEKRLQDTKTISSHEELYNEVQKIIEEDIVNEYGLTNVLARYYAYSCLPFMTDQAREYGMRIGHESMMLAYNALDHLTNRFGLQLIVPNLFADRITDGEYKDCTGEKYGDLENMCPGVANYVLGISNSDKQHYITDLVRVGYKKNYEVKQKAMVIVA